MIRLRSLSPLGLICYLCLMPWIGSAAAHGVADKDMIRIGTVLSLSGNEADSSQKLLRGYRLAVKKINEGGGINVANRRYLVELVVQDDHSNAAIAGPAAEAMIRNGVHFMLGPLAAEMVDKVADIAEARHVPLVQTGGASFTTQGQPPRQFFFDVRTPSDEYLSGVLNLVEKLALQAHQLPQEIRVAIATSQDPLGSQIHDAIIRKARDLGMQIVLDAALPSPLLTMQPVIDQITIAKPDILLVSAHETGARMIVRQMAETKTYVRLLAITHCDEAGIESLQPIGDYVVCALPWTAYSGYKDRWFGSAVKFFVDYTITYGEIAPPFAAQGAAGVLVLAAAIEQAGSLDPLAVREALSQTNLQTLYGPVRFDNNGRNIPKLVVFSQIQGGRYKAVWPETVAWSNAVFPAPAWENR